MHSSVHSWNCLNEILCDLSAKITLGASVALHQRQYGSVTKMPLKSEDDTEPLDANQDH